MRTTDEINAYLDAYREKKLKEREAAQLKKRQETKNRLKEVYAAQRKALQEAKRKRADELIEKLKIHQQKPPKWLTTPLSNNVGGSLFNEENLYTFEELVNIETLYPNEEGRLDWLKFNELVEKGRKEIAEILKHYHMNLRQ